MSLDRLLDAIATGDRDAVAIDDGRARITRGELLLRIDRLAQRLRQERVRTLATRLDNGIDAIVVDLAALYAGVIHVPLPDFFTSDQVAHVLATARVDTVIGPEPGWTRHGVERLDVPSQTAKITFTSGTTGAPKGVCLTAQAMLEVAHGIAEGTAALQIECHLCALPLAVLLENIAGVYAPLLRQATIVAPSLAAVGLQGATRFDPGALDASIRRHEIESVVLLPQMLRGWTAWLSHARRAAPESLRLVAVGGAKVGATAIDAAHAVGLPACEGYGLSEGASVQTLNLPGAQRIGSVGQALPHAQLRVAANGEIEIGGPLMLGYLGPEGRFLARPEGDWYPTGDLGTIDPDGFVHVQGRSKDVLITAYGRNVSPEWVESAIEAASTTVARAVVLGDARSELGAVLWASSNEVDDAQLGQAIAIANARLPDYARIGPWVRAQHRLDAAEALTTPNGRPRRAAIARHYLPLLFHEQEP